MSSYISFKGTYSVASLYSKNDLVFFNNIPYISKQVVRPYTFNPTSTNAWMPLTQNITSQSQAQTQQINTLLTLVNALNTKVGQQQETIEILQQSVASLTASYTSTIASFQQQLEGVQSRFQSLRLTSSGLQLSGSQSIVSFSDLLNSLADSEIFISNNGLEMASIRSAFGRIYSRLVSAESQLTDISGIKIATLEAQAAANLLTDSLQDVSGALLSLQVATAQSDLSGVLVRLQAIEAAPGFDAAPLTAAIADLSGNYYAYKTTNDEFTFLLASSKVDVSTYDAAMAEKASSADLLAANSRIDSVEASVINAQASADGAVTAAAAAQSAADAAASAASTAQATADAAEVKGYMSALEVVENSTAGVSAAYWGETQGATLAGLLNGGAIVNYLYDAPSPNLVLPVGEPATGKVWRLRNAHEEATLPISVGDVVYEIMPLETLVLQYNGSAWRLI